MSISGSWQIVSQNNGPSPDCTFEQAGNDLTGSCIGPNAKGAITGTITGDQPRWHWQWVTYAGNSSGSFDFLGTLKPDNTITGVILRRGTGLSLNFTAKRQSVAATAAPVSAPEARRAQWNWAQEDTYGTKPTTTPGPAPRVMEKWQPNLKTGEKPNQYDLAFMVYDKDLVSVAWARFGGDIRKMLEWLDKAQHDRDALEINRAKALIYPAR
jgi:hypothetical protein